MLTDFHNFCTVGKRIRSYTSFIYSFLAYTTTHHSPEWMILSHANCFVQGEVQWLKVMLGSFHPRSTGASQWSPPVLQWRNC